MTIIMHHHSFIITIIIVPFTSAAVPQDPSDFLAVVRDQVGAPKQHQKHLELVRGVCDWKAFFEPLGLSVHGHTRTHAMREKGVDAVHCFKFQRSGDWPPWRLGVAPG